MTNSERFHKAHTIAKQIRDCFSCYRDAFGFALSEVYRGENGMEEKTTEQKLIDLGIRAWERGDMRRYYMDDNGFERVFGLSVGRYNTGNISSARFCGESISHAKAGRLMGRAVYYDAVKGDWFKKTAFGVEVLSGELRDALRV